MGRPRKVFNLKQVYKLAALGCTDEEIAAVFDTTTETIRKRKLDDPDFLGAYKKGWAEIRQSLRRKQIAVAKKGSVVMLIWLGKQLLGQSERPEYAGAGDPDPGEDLVIGRDGARPLVIPARAKLEDIRKAAGLGD